MLYKHSVETKQGTSSDATRQGKLGHCRLSSLSHCGLILGLKSWCARADLHFKKKKKKSAGEE